MSMLVDVVTLADLPVLSEHRCAMPSCSFIRIERCLGRVSVFISFAYGQSQLHWGARLRIGNSGYRYLRPMMRCHHTG